MSYKQNQSNQSNQLKQIEQAKNIISDIESECNDIICDDSDNYSDNYSDIYNFDSDSDIYYSDSDSDIESDYYLEYKLDNNKNSINDHLYCNKCLMKKKANNKSSNIPIFNIINEIIFSSGSMPEVHKKMEEITIKINKWFQLNEDGLSVFHWFIWYISIKIKKYSYIKSRVYAFFQKIFSDNSITSIFSRSMINKIIKFGTPQNKNHTILYHLVRYCENPNDVFYIRIYNLLIDHGAKPLTNDQIIEIKQLNSGEEENIPIQLRSKISLITDNYKFEENRIVKEIELNHPQCKLNKCIECETLIDYTKEIPKIISYCKENKHDNILNYIWVAYYQRKLLNTVFNKYYNIVNAKSNLNMIHQRHYHILDIYTKNLYYTNDKTDDETNNIETTHYKLLKLLKVN
jgi:hypothetical protein